MENLTITDADHHHWPQVVELAVGVGSLLREDAEEWLVRNHDSERQRLVALVDGRVVGYATTLLPRDTFAAYLRDRGAGVSNVVENGRLMVHHRYRRRGIGSALVLELTKRAREVNMEPFALVLDGNEASQELHESLGWRRWGQYQGIDGLNLVYVWGG